MCNYWHLNSSNLAGYRCYGPQLATTEVHATAGKYKIIVLK